MDFVVDDVTELPKCLRHCEVITVHLPSESFIRYKWARKVVQTIRVSEGITRSILT